jgi:hypothetical protein
MPPDERATKVADRCATHPGRPKAAACERCGRSLCIVCAVPVRGVAYGPECLGEVLGDDAPPVEAPKPTRAPADRVAGVALLVALAATLAPWTRFGAGSGWFHGAWSADVRWSMLAAISALVGAIAWWTAKPGRGTIGRRVCLGACVGLAVGALLSILNPPPFTKPALAPWVALAAAIVALAALLARGEARVLAAGPEQQPAGGEGD